MEASNPRDASRVNSFANKELRLELEKLADKLEMLEAQIETTRAAMHSIHHRILYNNMVHAERKIQDEQSSRHRAADKE